jgi:hypothetical protein
LLKNTKIYAENRLASFVGIPLFNIADFSEGTPTEKVHSPAHSNLENRVIDFNSVDGDLKLQDRNKKTIAVRLQWRVNFRLASNFQRKVLPSFLIFKVLGLLELHGVINQCVLPDHVENVSLNEQIDLGLCSTLVAICGGVLALVEHYHNVLVLVTEPIRMNLDG